MAISRADLLKEMLPSIEKLFDEAYHEYSNKLPTATHIVEVDFEEEPSVVVLDHKNVRPMP